MGRHTAPRQRPPSRALLSACTRAARGLVIATVAAGVLAFMGLSLVPRMLGVETRTVVSGSMAPAIPAGSAIFVEPIPPDGGAGVGDVLLFRVPGHAEEVVHRKVAATETDAGTRYVTRGDANGRDDPWLVQPSRVIGRVVAHLPLAGFPAAIVTSRLGATVLLALPGLAIIVMEVPIWYRFIRYGRAAFEPSADGAASPAHLATPAPS